MLDFHKYVVRDCVIIRYNEIGIRVGHDRINSALDVEGTLHKK
jgi:hypothetical protein